MHVTLVCPVEKGILGTWSSLSKLVIYRVRGKIQRPNFEYMFGSIIATRIDTCDCTVSDFVVLIIFMQKYWTKTCPEKSHSKTLINRMNKE